MQMLSQMSKRFSLFVWVSVMLALIQIFIDFDIGYIVASATAAIGIAAGASLVGGLISDYINTKNQADTNEANRDIARENREWQSNENDLARAWSQHMWEQTNEYNTPSAQNARLREAGYNPYLISGLGSISSGNAQMNSAQTSSSAPQAPTMQSARVGAAANAMSQLPNQLMNYYSTDAQVNAANANAANQTAQSEKTIIENAQQIYKMYGRDASEKYFSSNMQAVKGSYDGNTFATQVQAEVENSVYTAKLQKIASELKSKYGEKEIVNNLNVQDQAITESVARIGKMASDRKVNDAKIKEIAASCVERIAHAWNLRKQGDKFVADTTTVNAIRQSVIDQMQYKANMMRRHDVTDSSLFNYNRNVRDWMNSEEGMNQAIGNFQTLQDEMLNELDRYIKVLSPFVDKAPSVNYKYSHNVYE